MLDHEEKKEIGWREEERVWNDFNRMIQGHKGQGKTPETRLGSQRLDWTYCMKGDGLGLIKDYHYLCASDSPKWVGLRG